MAKIIQSKKVMWDEGKDDPLRQFDIEQSKNKYQRPWNNGILKVKFPKLSTSSLF